MTKAVVIVGRCMILIRPGNKVHGETSSFRDASNGIKGLIWSGCMFQDGMGKGNVKATRFGNLTVHNVAIDGFVQCLGANYRKKFDKKV